MIALAIICCCGENGPIRRAYADQTTADDGCEGWLMVKTDDGTTTFAILEAQNGNSVHPALDRAEYPLPAWYRQVRNVPLRDLTVFDLARACRQKLFSASVVPLVLRCLNADLFAGDLYEGELLCSLRSIDVRYWMDHPDDAGIVRQKCGAFVVAFDGTDDITEQIKRLLARLG